MGSAPKPIDRERRRKISGAILLVPSVLYAFSAAIMVASVIIYTSSHWNYDRLIDILAEDLTLFCCLTSNFLIVSAISLYAGLHYLMLHEDGPESSS